MSPPQQEPLPEALIEYIPPAQQQGRPAKAEAPEHPGITEAERNATARIISRWLDELFTIPGSNFRIGLDPIMSLVPGVGDFLASSVSLVTIIESVRTGVPLLVIVRMCFNMVLNAIIGAVPFIGPFFSAFFKSNTRNLGLLQRCQEGEHHAVAKGSRRLLFGVVILIFLALASYLAFWVWLLWHLTQPLHG